MTISLPQEDISFQSREGLKEQIARCLGGRAAEQMVLGDISTGAGNDLQRASAIARNMVMRYGMSDKLGNVVFDSGHDEIFIGRSMAQAKTYSEDTADLIDREVKAFVDEAYRRCEEILKAHRKELELTAAYLLENETMDAATFEKVFTDPDSLLGPDGRVKAREDEETEPSGKEEFSAELMPEGKRSAKPEASSIDIPVPGDEDPFH